MMKKQRKKSRSSSKTGLAMDKELKVICLYKNPFSKKKNNLTLYLILAEHASFRRRENQIGRILRAKFKKRKRNFPFESFEPCYIKIFVGHDARKETLRFRFRKALLFG